MLSCILHVAVVFGVCFRMNSLHGKLYTDITGTGQKIIHGNIFTILYVLKLHTAKAIKAYYALNDPFVHVPYRY